MIKERVKEFIILMMVVYEGVFRNDKIEGKGINYFSDGGRRMGDYYNGKPIGKHIRLTKDGDVELENL